MSAVREDSVFNRLAIAFCSARAPIISFGLGLVAAIWFGAIQLLWLEHGALRRWIVQDISNLALVLDQNIARSIDDFEQTLRSLQQAYEREGDVLDWANLIETQIRPRDEQVQIAVINDFGMMITSSAMLRPPKPVDLSDREHYQVHAKRKVDQLFISKPLLGRASGKWSVQFTRPFFGRDGAFHGVVVVSLDPSHLARTYGGLKLGPNSGLAVLGQDGIVRAGSGIYNSWLGLGYKEGTYLDGTSTGEQESTNVSFQRFQGDYQIVASRQVARYPLEVVVAAPDVASRPDWQSKVQTHLLSASALSLLVVLVMASMLSVSRQHQEKMVQLARHDPLTGLANRVAFRERIQGFYSEVREGKNFALHVLDLDGFKSVNDTYGHPFGDKLLNLVSDRLRMNLRQSDFIARLGGDEFAVLQGCLPSDEAAGHLAERLCAILAEPYVIDGTSVTIGVSIGVAFGRKDGRAMAHLLKSADLALYAAKADGRGNYKFYSEDMNMAAKARREIESGLKEALRLDQFEVHYQSIMSIETGEVTAYEALIRWRHPQRGLVPPLAFIPIAEETGLIVKIGEWVLRRACLDMARCENAAKVAVNFSPIQFKDAGLVQMVESALKDAGLSPDRLEIEITESTLMQRDMRTIAHLTALRELGVQIAMDDFGTGYSSLSYLQTYPINSIKIDRSFVKALDGGSGSQAIIRAITTLATSLNMSTIAEGVETGEQLETLQQLGCTEAQGFYFGRPKPAAEILPLPVTRPRLAWKAA